MYKQQYMNPKCCYVTTKQTMPIVSIQEASNYIRQTLTEPKAPYYPLFKLKLNPEFKSMYVEDIRTHLKQQEIAKQIPFRIEECNSCPMACCGMCTRRCTYRCVQDLLHKALQMTRIPAEELRNTDPAPDTRHLDNLKEATLPANLPKLSYDKLQQLFNKVYLSIPPGGLNPWVENYAPQFARTRIGKDGRVLKMYDPKTGKAELYDWPTTGLCPFCVPAITTRKVKPITL